ncbi:MAG: tetratricopeptide repeat protein [Acidobacteriota bacterium]
MTERLRRTSRFLPLAFFLVALSAQDGQLRQAFELHGEVHLEPGGRLRRARALVTLHGAWTPYTAQTWTDLGGRFKFRKLPAGLYNLTAEVPRRGLRHESVDISASLADARGRIRCIITLQPVSTQQTATVSARQLTIPEKAAKEYLRAQKKLSRRKVDQAVAHLEKAVQLAPHFSRALNYLGTIAFQRQEYGKARQLFQQARQADPMGYNPLVNLGGALIQLQDFPKALEVNQEAVARRPQDPLAHSQLGRSYMYLGKDEKAVEHLSRARDLDPGHFSFPRLSLAQLHWRNDRREEAAEELEEFLRRHPDAAQAESVRQQLAILSPSTDP